MYKALVRSHLDYCDIIYHIPSLQNQPFVGVTLNLLMAKAESIQYKAALAITGAWQGSSRSKLYEEVGWEALSDRVCVGAFYRFIILLITRLLLTSKINYPQSVKPVVILITIVTPFRN